jgi:hypothetical protein
MTSREQGIAPSNFTVQFDAKVIDAALLALGEKPWPEPRPRLAILVGVKDMVRTYMLAEDQARGSDQRSAFADASQRFALPIIFPSEAQLQLSGVSYDTVPNLRPERLVELESVLGVDAVLAGHLDWSAKDHGWIGTWRLEGHHPAPAWSISGVNFDAAFRDAIGGAAKQLSDHQD